MKYVLLAVAFSALIIGAAVIYGELSKRYEQEIQPPVHTEQTMKTKPGTKVTNEKKTAETTDAGENTADSSLESAATTDPEKSLEKETERVSGATGHPVRNSGEEAAQKPPTFPGTSQQQTNTEKPNNTENPAGTAKPEQLPAPCRSTIFCKYIRLPASSHTQCRSDRQRAQQSPETAAQTAQPAQRLAQMPRTPLCS